jgi:hypothetical protein
MVGRTDAPLVGHPYQVRRRTSPPPAAVDGRLSYSVAMAPRPIVTILFAAVLVLGACAPAAAVSFDPTGPCTADGAAPGAYPDLEAVVPTSYEGRGPDRLDSGRNCTAENLGTLAGLGISELRFAGGTWDFGGNRAAALVVFEAPGLTAEAMTDFYEKSAAAANRTQVIGRSTPSLAGRAGHRLDTMTGDRQQTVVVWPAAARDRVDVVLSNDLPDPKIQAAVDAFGGQ